MGALEPPKVLSGDGLTEESAVKFEPCHLRTRVAAEYEYICSLYGTETLHWSEQMHFTSMGGQSVWVIELNDGTVRNIYFDTGGTIYDET